MAAPYNEEQTKKRRIYLTRLRQELAYRVRIGELSPEEAQTTYHETASKVLAYRREKVAGKIALLGPAFAYTYKLETLKNQGLLPYAEEIIGTGEESWQEEPWQARLTQLEQNIPPDLIGLPEEEVRTKMLTREETELAPIMRGQTASAYLGQLQPYLNAQRAMGALNDIDVTDILKQTQRRLDLGIKPSGLPEYQAVQDYWTNLGTYGTRLEKENLAAQRQFQQEQFPRAQEALSALSSGWGARASFGAPVGSEEQWEASRQRQLRELPERAWVDRWILMHQQNPYIRTESEELTDTYVGLLADIERNEKIVESAQPRIGEAWSQYNDLIKAMPEHIARQKAQALSVKSQLEATAGQGERWAKPVGTPPTPEWLTKFVPSLGVGEPVRRAPVPAPSPQQWSRTLPS